MSFITERVNKWVTADKARRAKRIMKKYNIQLTKAALRKGTGMGSALASSLYNNNFIHDRYFKELIKTGNRAKPEVELVYVSTIISAVRRLVYDDPEVFPSVIKILKQHEAIRTVVAKMEKEYNDDEDTILKVILFSSSSACAFGVTVMLLGLLVWYYVATPTDCLKLTPEVSQEIQLFISAHPPSVTKLNIEQLNSSCRELLDQYTSDTMTSCFRTINSNKDQVMDSSDIDPVSSSISDGRTDAINSNSNTGTDSINSNDCHRIYNASCVAEAIIRMESVSGNSCVQRIEPVLGCIGVSLNISELAHRTINRSNNSIYIIDESKTDL